MKKDRTVQFITDIFDNCFHTFIITWYNNIIQIHYVAQERLVPLVQYRDDQITSNNIGLIKFYITTVHEIQWLIQCKLFSHIQIKNYPIHYTCRKRIQWVKTMISVYCKEFFNHIFFNVNNVRLHMYNPYFKLKKKQ